MRKKISLLLLTLICALSFAGCASETTNVETDVTSQQQMGNNLLTLFTQITDEQVEDFENQSELELNLLLLQSGIPAEGHTFLDIVKGWRTSTEECGQFEGLAGEFEAEVTADEVVLTAPANFAERNADVVFVFDINGNVESFTVEPEYTIGEILTKAGLNTVLGMGTVFAVLIFIAFIISLLKYIPDMIDRMTGKGKKVVADAPVAAPVAVAPVVANVNNDLELIAVITAAIAAAEGTTTDGFVVRSIKRRKSNKWNA